MADRRRVALAAFAVLVLLGAMLLGRGTRWGSTPEERAQAMPGDEYLRGSRLRLAMTRAITIEAPPERVWPWIAQLGRGAGWYSVDWLDNGRKTSAWHLVSWIPEPRLGDATAIGYLRQIDPGRSVTWWLGDGRFISSRARMVKDPETGDRAQYQLYEICYAAGESAGVRGEEEGGRWREAAIEDGVLPSD